jgi:hypothetical protein
MTRTEKTLPIETAYAVMETSAAEPAAKSNRVASSSKATATESSASASASASATQRFMIREDQGSRKQRNEDCHQRVLHWMFSRCVAPLTGPD